MSPSLHCIQYTHMRFTLQYSRRTSYRYRIYLLLVLVHLTDRLSIRMFVFSLYSPYECFHILINCRTFLMDHLNPDITYLLDCIRIQLSVTVLIILVFFPKVCSYEILLSGLFQFFFYSSKVCCIIFLLYFVNYCQYESVIILYLILAHNFLLSFAIVCSIILVVFPIVLSIPCSFSFW